MDLKKDVLKLLPLGTVKPQGWLKKQLQIQAAGLTGHLDEFWEDLGTNNKWLGGEKEGWERGPYYADGLIPLAYLLDDKRLKVKAQVWIEAFLNYQDKEGWIGPKVSENNRDEEYDPWPIFVVLKALSQYYEFSKDQRVPLVMKKFFRYLENNLKDKPLLSWGKYRWADLVLSIHWLYRLINEDWLLKLAEFVAEQGYDWQDHFNNFKYTKKSLETKFETHIVNNAMGIKTSAVWYRQSGDSFDLETTYKAIENLDKFHGQATGVFSGDEHLSGKNPSQGTELCAVVEYMFTLENILSIIGDVAFADRLEKITFNALPATFTPDMWAHQYDQQVNQVICSVTERDWTNNPDANIFGLEPNFGCCTANMHQGWPKFCASLWMQTQDDGLAAVAYSPCEVSTILADGKKVTIIEETDYPFDDSIKFIINTEKPLKFPLSLRIPAWAEDAQIVLPNGETIKPPKGKFYKVEILWKPEDVLTLKLPMKIRTEHRYLGAVSLQRGPLIYSLKIAERWKQIGGEIPHADWEIYPDSLWSYALDLDLDEPEKSVQVDLKPVKDCPFSPHNAPVELKINGQYIQNWKLEDNWAGSIPHNLIESNGDMVQLTLIPYGCTNLRITEFPILF